MLRELTNREINYIGSFVAGQGWCASTTTFIGLLGINAGTILATFGAITEPRRLDYIIEGAAGYIMGVTLALIAAHCIAKQNPPLSPYSVRLTTTNIQLTYILTES